mgnify:CR=1 FL=1
MTKIMVVDDESALLHLVSEVLSEDLGHEVFTHESAESAIQALNENRELFPDLLITDYKMHGMTGAKLIETVHTEMKSIKNVLLTGYLEKDIQETLVPYETICIRKPVSLASLEKLIDEVLELK